MIGASSTGRAGRVKALLHLHTNYSPDSDISLEALVDHALAEGIGCVAVTDHDTIEGARALAEKCHGDGTDLQVIVGEEVTTRDGHLIGLFLEERVRAGMSALATAMAIREQGGLVLLPHPFVKAFGCGLNRVSYEIAEFVDAVEVNNAQNFFSRADRAADRFADEFGVVKYVGADSHLARSISPCWQVMAGFDGRDAFLESLGEAELCRGRHGLGYFAEMGVATARYFAGMAASAGMGVNATCDHRRVGAAGAEGVLAPGQAGSLVGAS